MIRWKHIFLWLGLAISLKAGGQDFRLSQYFSSPIHLNPAATGMIDGNLRLAANYRNQWTNVASFSTYAFAVDGNLFRQQLNDNFLGLGAAVMQNMDSKSGFSNTSVSLTTAFNIKLTSRPVQYLGLGIQTAMLRRQIDLGGAVWGNLYETGQNTDPIQPDEYGNFKFDVGTGLSWFVSDSRNYSILLGASIFHINRPDYGVLIEDRLYRKYIAHASAELRFGRVVGLVTSAMYANQGPGNELNIGLFPRFKPEYVDHIAVYAGIMYRLASNLDKKFGNEAIIAAMRVEVHNLYVGFSYDFTLSSLAAVNNRVGGPEVSLIVSFPFTSKDPFIKIPGF
jgi:type IX secretion system PorP/SprF family membrane protein